MSASQDPPIVVLHVDDEPDFTVLVSTVLERTNDQLDVVTATNAQEGLETLTTTAVDCVVSDHDMPGMDGLEFLAADEGDAEHFERVEHSLERMDRIISDVLWLSREGRGIGSTETVPLQDAVQDAWRVVANEDTTAELDIDADLGTDEADTDRLAQLLENLLRNAIEHGSTDERDTPPRDDALEHGKPATYSTSDPDAATIRVTRTPAGFAVEDDGPGIPAPGRERIFEHGYTTCEDGTGFGLSIVTDIVQARGWTITDDEGPLDGARFTISTT